jgi:hypothetical protein
MVSLPESNWHFLAKMGFYVKPTIKRTFWSLSLDDEENVLPRFFLAGHTA